MTIDETRELIQQDLDLLRIVSEKDTEISEHETETVRMVDKKDSEKRQFNWGALKAAGGVLLTGLGITLLLLGGDFDFKFPDKL